jgi:diguanylate cyclase (GGDEF)-like protein
MTALDQPVGVTDGSVAGLAADRKPVRDLLARIRASEYVTVGAGRRFRAIQRRRTRTASRAGFLVVAAAVVLDAVVLLGQSSDNIQTAIALDVAVMIGALGAWWLLPRQLYHRPEAAASVVMLGIVVSTVVSGTVAPGVAVQSFGYLLLLPSLIALVLPWRTIVHMRWLLVFTAVASTYLLWGMGQRFAAAERGELMVVLCVSIGTSLIGHGLLQRGQIRSFAQMQRIHALRRRTEADHRELERLHHELERTARIDPLTGAGNRRRLHEDLLVVRSHIDRSGSTYGLMEIDLDHFKGINDRLGHLAGDDVLRRVVEAVQAATRARDSVYRYGGEEFVVLLPMADRAQLLAAAERLRTAVLDLGIEHPDNAALGVVTVSIGATLIDDDSLDLTDEQWFYVVDRAMYAAKAGGRNQVRYATGLAA